MGWISDTFNKSVFTTDSYKYAIADKDTKGNGYAVFKMTPELKRSGKSQLDIGVIGVIQNPLRFSINAEWVEMGGINGLLPEWAQGLLEGGNKAANLAGFTDLGSVYASRKIYKKSGFFQLDAELKVVDWRGDGSPLKSAMIIAYLLVPDTEWGEKVQAMMGETLKDATNAFTNLVTKTGEAIDNGIQTIGEKFGNDTMLMQSYEGMKKFGNHVINTASTGASDTVTALRDSPTANKLYQNTLEGLSDYALLRASPSTVTVEVGNFFKQEDMILENASFEFSKEMTKAGPLYVDIKLQLSSRTIMGDLTKIGFNSVFKKDGGRIIFTDSNGSELTGNVEMN